MGPCGAKWGWILVPGFWFSGTNRATHRGLMSLVPPSPWGWSWANSWAETQALNWASGPNPRQLTEPAMKLTGSPWRCERSQVSTDKRGRPSTQWRFSNSWTYSITQVQTQNVHSEMLFLTEHKTRCLKKLKYISRTHCWLINTSSHRSSTAEQRDATLSAPVPQRSQMHTDAVGTGARHLSAMLLEANSLALILLHLQHRWLQ